MKRILIQNGTLYDGLGGQPYQADLLVQDDRIAQIAPGITESADQVIDATGKAVTPGGAVEICRILGRDETLRRLETGLDKLGAAGGPP